MIEAVIKVVEGKTLLTVGEIHCIQTKLKHYDPRLDLLTEQEKKILRLLTEGLVNKEIAARLYFAEKTVKNYV